VTAETVSIPALARIGEMESATPISRQAKTLKKELTKEDLFGRLTEILTEVTPQQRTSLQNTLLEFQDTFSKHYLDLGHTPLVQHRIPLTSDTPLKALYRKILHNMIDELLFVCSCFKSLPTQLRLYERPLKQKSFKQIKQISYIKIIIKDILAKS